MDLNHWNYKSSLQEFKIHDEKQQLQQPPGPGSLIRRVSKRNVGIKKSLASADGVITESFEPQQKAQTAKDLEFMIHCFKGHFVFSSMSENQLYDYEYFRSQLAKSMFYCRLTKGQQIIKQGDSASSFFIIEKGSINVLVDNVQRKVLTAGNGFGELALLYNAPRSATCVAAEECFLWGIDRHTFRKSVEGIMRQESDKNKAYIEHVKFFQKLTREQKDAIAGVLISQKFGKDEVIVNEGDQASSFYVIAEGSVGVFNKDGQQVATLNANDSFGESSLKGENQVRQMTIKALQPDTKILGLGKDMVFKILGEGVQNIIYKNICKWAMNHSHLFAALPVGHQEKLLESIVFKKVSKGEKLIQKGEIVGLLIILLEEDAVDAANNVVHKEQIIAEDTLYDKLRGTTHTNSYVSSGDQVIGVINYELFRQQQGSVEKIVRGHQEQQQSHSEFKEQIKQLPLKDLTYLAKLGSGQFGSVYLCKFQHNETLFALKYVTRAHVVQFGIQKHIQQEKNVLELMDHEFILKFYRSYKDNENIYLLTEYIPGMELFDAIRVIGLLDKVQAQFYTAQMLLMMEYLHSVHQIVYRDLKPENIMVDDHGYLKLIDMGTAKSFKNVDNKKTFTIIGTPHYMAPEVISGKGYGMTADLWSVGVCLYEFICGGLPFGEEAEDPFEIYKEIIKKPITYPTFMSDKTAKAMIEQLMNKIPEIRLGGSYTTLRGHTWFKDFNFEQLLARKFKAPFQPPKDKILTPEQLKGFAAKKISVVDQVQKDTKDSKKVIATAKDAEWDAIF